jgi:hypothetical protein
VRFLLDQDVYALTERLLRGLGHDVVHNQLKRVLEAHSETDLAHAFIVVEPGGYRIRKLP